MRRREFLGVLVSAAAAWSLPARAQKSLPRVGVLLVGGPEQMGPFQKALRDLGYVEGKNIQLVFRSAEGKGDRLPQLAAELVRDKVDIIVASLTPSAIAAKNATHDIPIVMAPVGDPVGSGLIASLAHPGGNITGLSATSAELGSKTLELIREVLPKAQRVAVIGLATDPFSKAFVEQIRQGAHTGHFDIRPHMVGGDDELENAFAAMTRERTDAVIIQVNLPVQSTVELALKHRLPAFSHQKSVARAGAVVSYSASFAERGREIAGYVDKILKGAKPANLPVQQPDTYELVINLKTAKLLGITIPGSMLTRADEVIE
jgi:putative ABC transport system substrate-binding protein